MCSRCCKDQESRWHICTFPTLFFSFNIKNHNYHFSRLFKQTAIFYPLLSAPSLSSLYKPPANHTSSSPLRMFLLPTFPGPRSVAVKLLRRVTRDSISLHIGCNSSSEVISGVPSLQLFLPSFLVMPLPFSSSVVGVNLFSSLSICFRLHCIDAARDDAAGSDGPSSSPDVPFTAPFSDAECRLLPTSNLADSFF
jgi:hypothetical protein